MQESNAVPLSFFCVFWSGGDKREVLTQLTASLSVGDDHGGQDDAAQRCHEVCHLWTHNSRVMGVSERVRGGLGRGGGRDPQAHRRLRQRGDCLSPHAFLLSPLLLTRQTLPLSHPIFTSCPLDPPPPLISLMGPSSLGWAALASWLLKV